MTSIDMTKAIISERRTPWGGYVERREYYCPQCGTEVYSIDGGKNKCGICRWVEQ